MRRLEDRAVIVFGSASGIGAASARRLAQEGAAVCLGDVNLDLAAQVAEEIAEAGGTAFVARIDIADEQSVADGVALALERFGKLDGAHVNAADMLVLQRDSTILDIALEDFDRTIAVNLRGHVLCTRAVLPHLLANPQSAIVYTSSGAWNAGEPQRPGYAIAKAGMNALMRHVAAGWGKRGLTANCIAPGLTPTGASTANTGTEFEATALAFTPHQRLGLPEDHAAAVAFLMSGDGRWINGQVLNVNGGSSFQ